MKRKRTIGCVSIDSGLLWIGDPCYVLHKNTDEIPRSIGRTWDEFCDIIKDKTIHEFDHNGWVDGLGVVVSTGGDGYYPVIGTFDEEDILTEVTIKFKD